jgi:hypothetical protein
MPTRKKKEAATTYKRESLDAGRCKEMLGWREVGTAERHDPMLRAMIGYCIEMKKNLVNRPLAPLKTAILTLKQEFLNRRFKYNGVSIVIGDKDNVLDGQCRMIALILADRDWRDEDKPQWKEISDEPPVLDALVVYGMDESDEIFRTFNCGKVGTLADVIYRGHYFGSKKDESDRLKAAKFAESAVKLLWDRLRLKKDAYAPYRTHGEAIEFLDNHMRIVRAVDHIIEENRDRKLGKDKKMIRHPIFNYLSPGYAAGLLYLMACSGTDPEKITRDRNDDAHLDFGRWDKAAKFWSLLARSDDKMMEVKHAIAALANEETGQGGTAAERRAILSKAWLLHVANQEITKDSLELDYDIKRADDGQIVHKRLMESPSVGGIDQGDMAEEDDDTPLPEGELEKRIDEANAVRAQKKQEKADAELRKAEAKAKRPFARKTDKDLPDAGLTEMGKVAAADPEHDKKMKERAKAERTSTIGKPKGRADRELTPEEQAMVDRVVNAGKNGQAPKLADASGKPIRGRRL